ncbi:hypothetical protein N9L68_06000 [bacterium]|nr:hypothetical protein [bacterium]
MVIVSVPGPPLDHVTDGRRKLAQCHRLNKRCGHVVPTLLARHFPGRADAAPPLRSEYLVAPAAPRTTQTSFRDRRWTPKQ